jgi:ubiquinone/menaquinone biosynthesis C-methylase UbiE
MSEFDSYRDTYREEVEQALPGGIDLDRFTDAKAGELLDLARLTLGDPRALEVLDVGCGTGETDARLAGAVGALHGTDVSESLLERAREANPGVEYRAAAPGRLPYGPDAVDLAFCINVMHHVPPPEWPAFVAEMARVTRPGGVVAVFEHNPLNPLTRRVVSRCSFDADAVLLRRRRVRALLAGAGLAPVAQRYILFVPSAAPWARALERPLRWLPLGAQYFVAGRVT